MNGLLFDGPTSSGAWLNPPQAVRAGIEPARCDALDSTPLLVLSCCAEMHAGELSRLGIQRGERSLDGVDLFSLEDRFPALRADPCGDGIPLDVIPSPICVKRCFPAFQLCPTMNARHGCLLLRNPGSQVTASGRYAVMIAKYWSLGATTVSAGPVGRIHSHPPSPRGGVIVRIAGAALKSLARRVEPESQRRSSRASPLCFNCLSFPGERTVCDGCAVLKNQLHSSSICHRHSMAELFQKRAHPPRHIPSWPFSSCTLECVRTGRRSARSERAASSSHRWTPPSF